MGRKILDKIWSILSKCGSKHSFLFNIFEAFRTFQAWEGAKIFGRLSKGVKNFGHAPRGQKTLDVSLRGAKNFRPSIVGFLRGQLVNSML